MWIIILISICVLLLQIYLSKRESKYAGLILPAISLLYSIILILGMVFGADISPWQIAVSILSAFCIYNISTLILLAIYFFFQAKRRKKKEMNKMNIQDLN